MRKNFYLMQYFFLAIIFQITLSAQDVNITGYLKRIESGEAEDVRKDVGALLKSNPGDPSVLFLDAILTEAGDEAIDKYKSIYEKHPKFAYADAVLYRIFSYYFALGSYKTAEQYLTKLKTEFPDSPYLKIADRTIPEEEIEFAGTPVAPVKEREEVKNNIEIKRIAKELFTVQAGAFLNYSNAQRLKKNFESKGYFSSIYPKEVGGSILNVVIVGKFNNKDEAQKFLPVLKSRFKTEGRVIPLKSQ